MRNWLLGLSALLMIPAAVAAQDASVAEGRDTHAQFIEAIEHGADKSAMLRNTLQVLARGFAQDQEIAALEGKHPGLIAQLTEATRPALTAYSERVGALFRVRLLEVARSQFTSEEAAELATFYASPLGRKLVGAVATNYRPESVMASTANDGAATAEHVTEDIGRAANAAVAALSAEELAEITRLFASRPVFQKLLTFNASMAEVRAEFENRPMTEEEERTMSTAIAAVFERVVGQP